MKTLLSLIGVLGLLSAGVPREKIKRLRSADRGQILEAAKRAKGGDAVDLLRGAWGGFFKG